MGQMRMPKYMTIKSDLQNKIITGVYKPGDLIPSDNELMRSLNVSKSTITQALRQLESDGFITRQQGKGSFVTDRNTSKPSLSFYISPMDPEEQSFWKTLIDSFNEECPDVAVLPVFLSNDSAPVRDKLFQAFASGNAPDMITLDGPDMPYWVYMQSLLPLETYLDSDFTTSILDQIIRQGSYRGHLYHLGYTESSLCILYNKELFSSLGIIVPSSINDAWSWDAFFHACELIKKKTSYQYPLLMDSGKGISTLSGEWISYAGLTVIHQNGGTVFNPELTMSNGYVNSPATIQAMQWVGELFHKYHFTHMEMISEKLPDDFAMSLSLPSVYIQNRKRNDNIGIMPLPHGVLSASPRGSWGISVTRQAKNPEQCIRFIKYVFTIRNQIRLSKCTGMPVMKEIYEVMDSLEPSSVRPNILLDQLTNTSFFRPQTPAYPFFSSHFALASRNICMGCDVRTELNNLADLVDNHLTRHRYYND